MNQEAQFSGQFLADPFDAWHQLPTSFRVHQGNQAIPNFQTNQIHLVDVIPIQLFRRAAVSSLGWWCSRFDFINGLTADHHVADAGGQTSQREENHVWHAGYQPQQGHDARGDEQRRRVGELGFRLLRHGLRGRHTRHDDGSRQRQEQRGDLCDQAITNGQQYINTSGFREGEVVLRQADSQTTNDVDNQNQQARHGVATDKL